MAERGRGVVAGGDAGRAGLAAVGTWHQQLLLFSLPGLQPLLTEDLGEVTHPFLPMPHAHSPPPALPFISLQLTCFPHKNQVVARHERHHWWVYINVQSRQVL